jgi:hypothetical protein
LYSTGTFATFHQLTKQCITIFFLVDTILAGISPDATDAPSPTTNVPLPSPSVSPEPTALVVIPAPTLSNNACQSVNGEYGQVQDGEALVVSFQYGVELTQDTSESELTSMLLPDLESALNDAILPTLFAACATNSTRRRSLSVPTYRQLLTSIMGISTRPFDSVGADIPCLGANCFGVQGTLTVFLAKNTTRRTLQEESHETMIRQALRDDMDTGSFNNVAESIINVTWIDDGLDGSGEAPNPPPATNGENSNQSTSRDNSQVVGWTVSAGAVAFLVAVVVVAARRRRRNNHDDESAVEGVSTTTSGI